MEEKDYVSPKVSKLLREVGFGASEFYYIEGDFHDGGNWYPKPTLYDAQKWLREKRNIHISVERNTSGYYWELCKANNGTSICDFNWGGPNPEGCWDTFETAIDDGILKALEHLIKIFTT